LSSSRGEKEEEKPTDTVPDAQQPDGNGAKAAEGVPDDDEVLRMMKEMGVETGDNGGSAEAAPANPAELNDDDILKMMEEVSAQADEEQHSKTPEP